MAAPELHKPVARQVENSHGQKPHGVNESKAVAVAGGSLRKVCDDRCVPDRLMKGETTQDVDSSHGEPAC